PGGWRARANRVNRPNDTSRWKATAPVRSSLKLKPDAASPLATPTFNLVTGKTPALPPLTPTTEVESVGIARATKDDVTPAGKKFCEILRQLNLTRTGADYPGDLASPQPRWKMWPPSSQKTNG